MTYKDSMKMEEKKFSPIIYCNFIKNATFA